jgi:hypothetical protein
MKQLFSILAMSCLVVSISFAQTAKPVKANGPEISFEKTTVAFGNIEQGSNPFRVVKFTNTGSKPLVITKAIGSCGCTVPTTPKEPIAPGETAEIKVRYDTNRLGKINKKVTITTNAGVKILNVTGNVSKKKAKSNVPASKKKSILDQ